MFEGSRVCRLLTDLLTAASEQLARVASGCPENGRDGRRCQWLDQGLAVILRMDRRVHDGLLKLLQLGGALEVVLELVRLDRTVRGLQLRALPGDASAGRGTASVYVGMSAVISVVA